MKKGLKKTLVNKVITVKQRRTNFTAESIYTRHLKFGMKNSASERKGPPQQRLIRYGRNPLRGTLTGLLVVCEGLDLGGFVLLQC